MTDSAHFNRNRSNKLVNTRHVFQINEALKTEVEYLHCILFKRNAPQKLIDSYIAAHRDMQELVSVDECQRRTIRSIVEHKLDALGIEPWLRSGHRRHLLSSKLLLIVYLAECDASHHEFDRLSNGIFHGFLRLVYAFLLATMRLIRGRVQKAIYGLV